jgi:hypothetical protein
MINIQTFLEQKSREEIESFISDYLASNNSLAKIDEETFKRPL